VIVWSRPDKFVDFGAQLLARNFCRATFVAQLLARNFWRATFVAQFLARNFWSATFGAQFLERNLRVRTWRAVLCANSRQICTVYLQVNKPIPAFF
jgi:hypothetical protein